MPSLLRNPRVSFPLLSLLLTLPWLLTIYRPAEGGLDVTGHPIGRDFINVWAGPQLAFSGRFGTLLDLDAYHAAIGQLFGAPLPFHNWGYPPFSLILFRPFAALPYGWALAAWTILLFAAFAGVTASQVPAGQRLRAVLVLALAPACLINLVGGQNGFLTAALFLGGILALDRRPVLAGILFGLLTIKPHLGLALPFALLALGAGRAIAAATVTALVLVGVSVLTFGVEPWMHYFGETGVYQLSLLQRFQGFYTVMMTSVVAGARTFGLSFQTALLLQAAVALPVLVGVVWAVRRSADPQQRAFVLASAAPLVTPYAFNYDLTALAAVLVWRLMRPAPSDPETRLVVALAWFMPMALMALAVVGLGLAPLALIAAFALSLREVAASAPRRATFPGALPQAAGA